jgi:plastocyanin
VARNPLRLLSAAARRDAQNAAPPSWETGARLVRGLLMAFIAAMAVAVPLGQEGTGSVSGLVTLTSRVRGTALPSNVYTPRAIHQHDAAPAPELKNVVVYLKNVKYAGVLAPTHEAIRQEHETFLPHVLAVTRGSTVDFPNDDPFFHDVFSLSSAATFDLGHYPPGQSRSQKFAKAGLVKIYCHIHSQMSASILVLDHPYFAIPNLDGTFTLPNVPAGHYTIVGWHERIGERTASVDVEPGKTAAVNLSLPVEDAP